MSDSQYEADLIADIQFNIRFFSKIYADSPKTLEQVLKRMYEQLVIDVEQGNWAKSVPRLAFGAEALDAIQKTKALRSFEVDALTASARIGSVCT